MNTLSHSRKIHIRLCRCLEIILLFLMGTLPVMCGYLLFYFGEDTSSFPPDAGIIRSTLGDNLSFIIDNLVIFFVLLQMFMFSKGVRKGELFTKSRIKNIRDIGLALTLGYSFNLFFRVFFDSATDKWNADFLSVVNTELYSLQQLLLGGGVLSLSFIFEKGRMLEEESELVI
ncbi:MULTISPECIES: DUF2975 domain-containing protein [Serratia]|uniref:DUF2975 domain-containing protein n=1 Tax=Serratia TaxID=613 RepID=UPI002880FB68|nr:DUF2975 domain-containing protein [Serratia marcescens]MDT0204633.1 DUF2975 domain-containing protein [Serratia marcescens]